MVWRSPVVSSFLPPISLVVPLLPSLVSPALPIPHGYVAEITVDTETRAEMCHHCIGSDTLILTTLELA